MERVEGAAQGSASLSLEAFKRRGRCTKGCGLVMGRDVRLMVGPDDFEGLSNLNDSLKANQI